MEQENEYRDRVIGLKGQVCILAYELAATWRRRIFIQDDSSDQSELHNVFVIDDITINIVLILLLIIIIK